MIYPSFSIVANFEASATTGVASLAVVVGAAGVSVAVVPVVHIEPRI
ncbi:MAG: hypothetical protein WCP92_07030 [bacterium]